MHADVAAKALGGCCGECSCCEGGGRFGERKHGAYWKEQGVAIAPLSVHLMLHHTDKNPSALSTRWKADSPSGPLNMPKSEWQVEHEREMAEREAQWERGGV